MNPTTILVLVLLITLLTVILFFSEQQVRELKREIRKQALSEGISRARLVVLDEQNRTLRQALQQAQDAAQKERGRAIGVRYTVDGREIWTWWN